MTIKQHNVYDLFTLECLGTGVFLLTIIYIELAESPSWKMNNYSYVGVTPSIYNCQLVHISLNPGLD